MAKPTEDPSPWPPPARTRFAVLSPRALIKAVFVEQLRLRRDGASEPAQAARVADAPVAAALLPNTPAVQAHRALRSLLDSRSDSRRVLKHLAALERDLGKRSAGADLAFLDELTLSGLQTLLRQLHGLIAPPAAPGIALLQSALLEAAEEQSRRALDHERAGAQPISSFLVDHKLEVREASTSALDLFDEVGGPTPGPR